MDITVNQTVKKSDFVLVPYMKPNNWRATYQVMVTVIPYLLLWGLAVKVAAISLWLLPPVLLLLTLFAVRCFSLMHDCGHYSLFSGKKVNRVVGFILGVINAIPQYPWSRGHAYHHKTNGDWERYRGPSGLLSTAQFAQLTPKAQQRYAMLRQPLMIIPGGFFYLAIKPRLALILGAVGFVGHVVNGFKQSPRQDWRAMAAAYESKHWYTTAEFWDLLLNNICVVGGWVWLSHWLGAAFFLSTYGLTLTGAAAVFICVFFVQHNFEGSYAHKTVGWDYLRGAIEGSSILEFPSLLRWFVADIGYHNIHHLSERIPNYNLAACHEANIHLLTQSTTLRFRDIPNCFKFILWDEATDSLMSIAAFHQAAATLPAAESILSVESVLTAEPPSEKAVA
jgi:acyl-lipid omega-6 desaturase (Delta-12 desaturase)